MHNRIQFFVVNHAASSPQKASINLKLTSNVEKTGYIIIKTRRKLNNLSQDIKVSIDGKVLKEVETKKFLGVLIDEHLCWDKQIDNIS